MKKLDLTKPLQLRNGTPVQILCTDLAEPHSVLGTYKDKDGNKRASFWLINGRYAGGNIEHAFDLINVPEKRTVECWLNVSEDFYGGLITSFFSTREAADEYALSTRIACLHLKREFEVGEGL